MTYGTGHLSDILKGNVQDHDFGEANLKQIPKALESPVAIFASSTRPDSSVVAILDLSYNNKPMFAAVEIDGTGKLNGENIDSNAITTLHTRKNAANMLNKALAKESMVMCQCTIWTKIKPSSASGRLGYNSPGL